MTRTCSEGAEEVRDAGGWGEEAERGDRVAGGGDGRGEEGADNVTVGR